MQKSSFAAPSSPNAEAAAPSDGDLQSLVALLTHGSLMTRWSLRDSSVSSTCDAESIDEDGSLENAIYDDEEDGENIDGDDDDEHEDDTHSSSSSSASSPVFIDAPSGGSLCLRSVSRLCLGPVLDAAAFGSTSSHVFSLLFHDDGEGFLQLTAGSTVDRDGWIVGLQAVLTDGDAGGDGAGGVKVVDAKDVKFQAKKKYATSRENPTKSASAAVKITHPPLHSLRPLKENSFEEKEIHSSPPSKFPSTIPLSLTSPSPSPSSDELRNVVSLSHPRDLCSALSQLSELCARVAANDASIDGIVLSHFPLSLSPSSTPASVLSGSASAADSYAARLCAALERNTRVRLLSLQRCGLTLTALEFITRMIGVNETIAAIVVRDDDMSLRTATTAERAAFERFCDTFASGGGGGGRGVSQLYLKHLGLGADACKPLARLVAAPRCRLRALDVGGNALGAEAAAVCAALEKNERLEALGMEENAMDEKTGKIMLEAVKKHMRLHTLAVQDNGFSATLSKAIEKEMAKKAKAM